ncbi:cupin domain-containing protein [Vibrio sp.]|nr:cupin domain-containing protein [Vibrio sp.]
MNVKPNVELSWHTHPVINAGVLVKGELTVITKEGKERIIVPGEAVAEVLGTVHKGINKGNEPVEIIVFYAGVSGTPLTVNEEE